MSAIAVRFDTWRTVAAASIPATYTALGTPTQHLVRILKVVNDTNAALAISFDGTTDNDYIPANSFVLYDFQSNTDENDQFYLSKNTQLYVRYSAGAPTTSSVYAIMIYGKGQ